MPARRVRYVGPARVGHCTDAVRARRADAGDTPTRGLCQPPAGGFREVRVMGRRVMGRRSRAVFAIPGAGALALASLPGAAPTEAAAFTTSRFDDPRPDA